MTPFRPFLIAAAALAVAMPAAAQSLQDFVGTYPMQVTAKTGEDCGGDDSDLRFVIHRIAGPRLTFGFEGEDQEVADWDAASGTFRFEQAVAGDDAQSGVLIGKLTRQADAVRLDLDIRTKGCGGTMVGLRPAAPLVVAPTPPTTIGPATAASEDAAAAPATPATAPATGLSLVQMAMFGGAGLALLALGVMLGWFLNRRGAPDSGPTEPPPPPPPADEPDA